MSRALILWDDHIRYILPRLITDDENQKAVISDFLKVNETEENILVIGDS